MELRVVVDIIAGASAGGINGTMLARALSHDLPMGPMRDLWLDNADVSVLLAPDTRAGAWSKWFLKPFLWGAAKTGMLSAIRDMEVRQKLSLFVRSRWFRPPLDGRIMAGLMYDAVTTMGAPKRATASLLPSGHTLDLFVTLTDYHGYHQLVQIHDPPLIHELDHHHVLQFTYRRRSNGEVESDFDLDNAPALAFAARATSSFPGAFPPARIVEIDEVVAQRRTRWPRRADFIAKAFQHHLHAGVDPTTAAFIDGAVLNNRPFQQAISAIHGRPAYRQVDRRLVYIEPHPAPPDAGTATAAGLLRNAARRHVRHSSVAAGDRRAQLGHRLQRPGAPPARHHRQRASADQPAGRHGGHRAHRPADHRRRIAGLARAGQRPGRARRGLRLSGLCPAQACVGARLWRGADRQAARRTGAIAALARGGRDHRCLGAAQGYRLRARRQRGARVRTAEGADHLPGWVNTCLRSTSNIANGGCTS